MHKRLKKKKKSKNLGKKKKKHILPSSIAYSFNSVHVARSRKLLIFVHGSYCKLLNCFNGIFHSIFHSSGTCFSRDA